jgi:hypothetical protein
MLIKSLGLDYEMICAFQNDYVLYQKNFENKYEFPTYGKYKWKVDALSIKVHKYVFSNMIRYFSIVPRLKIMYRYDFELFNSIVECTFMYYQPTHISYSLFFLSIVMDILQFLFLLYLYTHLIENEVASRECK